jgi:aldose 1-epimerase
MNGRARPFGRLADGRAIEAVALGDEGVQVEVLTYGAILRRLSFPVRGVRRDLILFFEDLAQYESDRAYVGPLVGRFGNRIARGRFSLDGTVHQLTINEGANHLHGGALGFGKRVWRVETCESSRLVLGYCSPDGEEGYPGTLDVSVAFSVSADRLRIDIDAHADAATPVNLTYHPYFNLAGRPQHLLPGSALDHWLRIPADHYLPVGPGLIPTGELAPVAGTAFDFRHTRRLAPPPAASDPQLMLGGGYDHCWVLTPDADCSAELMAPERDLTLTLRGNGPGLQLYNGQFLTRTHPALGQGLILEPQGLPDAPNHPGFPLAIVRPGRPYHARIEYQMSA